MNDIVADISRALPQGPRQVRAGAAGDQVSAALWAHDVDGTIEVEPGPLSKHVLMMRLSDHLSDAFVDGRQVHRGRTRVGGLALLTAGSTPRAVNEGRWRMLQVYLCPSLVASVRDDEELRRLDPAFLLDSCGDFDDVQVARLCREVLQELGGVLPLSRMRLDVLGLDLLIQAVRRRTGAGVDVSAQRFRPDWRLRRAMDILESRLGEDISVPELAAEIGVSAAHLTVLFKAGVGASPHRWLVERRLDRGATMLAKTDRPVVEIALQCGFSSSQHLALSFKRRFGFSPTAYRRLFQE